MSIECEVRYGIELGILITRNIERISLKIICIYGGAEIIWCPASRDLMILQILRCCMIRSYLLNMFKPS